MRKSTGTIVASFLAISFGLGWTAGAEETNENRVSAQDVKEKKNVTPGNDIDETITNNLMRAETGSKDRYSFSSQLYYNGGSVESPLSINRPNIAAMTATTDTALLGGQVSGKYNINPADSVQVGVGVRWIAPLQGSQMPDKSVYDGNKVDADNPYLIYQHLYKWWGIQSALQFQPTYYTQSNLTHQGYVSQFWLDQNNIYEIGSTGLSLGLYLLVGTGVYNNNSPDVLDQQATLIWNFDPFIEYQINKTFNFRTVTNLWNYEHTRAQDNGTYHWDKVTQSVGLGISISRDIFLYPNVQFLPDNVRADLTNVALNTYINL